jgi:phospholipase/carboxylesterase
MTDDDVISLEPLAPANACVIWLHGLGADGHDFESVASAMDIADNHSLRYLFPHAPVRPVTLNGGMSMRAWYDIYGIGKAYEEDETGISESHQRLSRLIEAQIDLGIPSSRIILIGFSQGGSMVLHTGLRYQQALAGVACLSGYLSLRQSLAEQLHASQQQTPILMMHGTDDQVVEYTLAEQSYQLLNQHQLNMHWQQYAHGHTVSMEQLDDLSLFINHCLTE